MKADTLFTNDYENNLLKRCRRRARIQTKDFDERKEKNSDYIIGFKINNYRRRHLVGCIEWIFRDFQFIRTEHFRGYILSFRVDVL